MDSHCAAAYAPRSANKGGQGSSDFFAAETPGFIPWRSRAFRLSRDANLAMRDFALDLVAPVSTPEGNGQRLRDRARRFPRPLPAREAGRYRWAVNKGVELAFDARAGTSASC